MGNFKKRNVEPAVIDTPVVPKELPALRTFLVRYHDNDEVRTIDAHGVSFDETGMAAFVVFFFVDGETQQKVAQANVLVAAAGSWKDVEEVNALFPTMEKH